MLSTRLSECLRLSATVSCGCGVPGAVGYSGSAPSLLVSFCRVGLSRGKVECSLLVLEIKANVVLPLRAGVLGAADRRAGDVVA